MKHRKHFSSRKKGIVKLTIAFIVLATIGFSSFFILNKKEKNNDKIIAKINKMDIYESQMNYRINEIFSLEEGAAAVKIEQVPNELLEVIAKEIYLEQQIVALAKKEKIESNSMVKLKLQNAENKILVNEFFEKSIGSTISEDLIVEKYNEINDSLADKNEYDFSYILTKTETMAKEIIKSAKKTKFAELVKKYNHDKKNIIESKNAGYNLEKNIEADILNFIKNAKKQDISSPIKSKNGFYIVKLNNIKSATKPDFEKVKGVIRQNLFQEKMNQIYDDILKNAKIEILIKSKNANQEDVKEKSSE